MRFSSVCCKSIETNHRPEWIRTSQGTRAPDGLDIDDGRGGHPSASRGTQQGARPARWALEPARIAPST